MDRSPFYGEGEVSDYEIQTENKKQMPMNNTRGPSRVLVSTIQYIPEGKASLMEGRARERSPMGYFEFGTFVTEF